MERATENNRRWWDGQSVEPTGGPPGSPAAEGSISESEELARLRAEVKDSQDRYLRTRADMENYKKRVESTYAGLARETRRRVLAKFLPVLDNLDRALACADPSSNGSALIEGVELTRKQFLAVLADEGVRPIETEGQAFDPRLHEAVGVVEVAEGEGLVAGEVQKGYLADDDLLRPARVLVTKVTAEAGG